MKSGAFKKFDGTAQRVLDGTLTNPQEPAALYEHWPTPLPVEEGPTERALREAIPGISFSYGARPEEPTPMPVVAARRPRPFYPTASDLPTRRRPLLRRLFPKD